MADQENPKPPAALIYEDTGSAASLVYFDIVGAYGIMHGTVEIELATRILVPATERRHRREIPVLGTVALQSDRRRQFAQRARCRAEDAGAAAAATRSGGGVQDELSARARRHFPATGGFPFAPSKGLFRLSAIDKRVQPSGCPLDQADRSVRGCNAQFP